MKRRLAVLLLVLPLAAALFWWWPRAAPLAQTPVNGRLPQLAVPDHYLLRLTLLPEQAGFRGEVEIGLQLREAARSLYLHGRDLTVNKVEVLQNGQEPIQGSYQQLTPQGLARIDFADTVPAGFLTLVLHYDGRYTSTSEGLSRIKVGNDWYVFSQFHPIEARRVFPGFDEPAFKAAFELEIISWRNDAVIGNGLPSETRLLPGDLKLTRLNRTPRLPSYLLNISVGPFDVVNGPVVPANEVRQQPLTLRAVTTRGEGGRTRFALEHTATMLTAFEQYFAIPYPFEKLDLIAVPDTSSGVLENPGAINFRDQLMLLDEQASTAERQSFLSYNAHALAHQWFGDLVTMPWWNDLWLNEGFADWLGYEIAGQSHPEYPLTLAMQQQLELAMQRDGRRPLDRIVPSINREEDIPSAFNTVAYDKAMGLLRMYQRYLGNEQFRQGLRNYFARHAFGNAGAGELFQSLGDAVADPTVTLSFEGFLQQPGLPQIRLQQQCLNADLQLTLRQQPYAPAGTEPGSQWWQIPVCLRTPDTGHQACRLLKDPEVVWSPGWRCDQLVIPNASGAGYYRWQVDSAHRRQLLAALPRLPRAEALDISANLIAAFRAGDLDSNELFAALPILAQHPDAAVLDSTLDNWRYLLHQLASPAQRLVLQQRLRQFFARPALVDANNVTRQQFRALDLHDAGVSASILKRHQAGITALKKDQAATTADDALAVALALRSDHTLLANIQRRLQQESRNDRRAPLVQALAWQQAPELLPGLQQLLLDPSLRIHERMLLLQASLSSPTLQTLQWQWLQSEFATLLPLLPDYQHSQLPVLAESLCDAQSWQSLQRFLHQQAATLGVSDSSMASTSSHVSECVSLRQQLHDSLSTPAASRSVHTNGENTQP